MITHGMNFWNCINLGVPAGIGIDTVHLSVLPLFHTGGLNCYSNPVLHAGGTVVILKAFDPGEALRILGDPQHGITHFFAVPAPYQFMMQHLDFATTDLSRLRVAGVGGAPCALTIMEAWAGRGVLMVQGFGMTETSPACIFLDSSEALRKVGSTGKVLLHTEMRTGLQRRTNRRSRIRMVHLCQKVLEGGGASISESFEPGMEQLVFPVETADSGEESEDGKNE